MPEAKRQRTVKQENNGGGMNMYWRNMQLSAWRSHKHHLTFPSFTKYWTLPGFSFYDATVLRIATPHAKHTPPCSSESHMLHSPRQRMKNNPLYFSVFMVPKQHHARHIHVSWQAAFIFADKVKDACCKVSLTRSKHFHHRLQGTIGRLLAHTHTRAHTKQRNRECIRHKVRPW